MKFSFNAVVQAIAIGAQFANAVTPVLDQENRAKVAAGIGAAQAIVAFLAHFRNPDGSPAVLPYDRKK